MLPVLDMPIQCHAWAYITCLEIPAENCQSEQHFYNKDKNKQLRSQIKIHWKNTTKIEKYKKLKYKVSKNKHTADEDKNTLTD